MNKKISTLLAAFLAAGFSYNAEAGIVKVTDATQVSDGRVFVVGTADYVFGNSSKYLLDEASGTTLKATASIASSAAIVNTQKWKWVATGAKLESVEATGNFITQNTTTAGIDASSNIAEFKTYVPADGLQTSDGTNPEFAVTSATPAFQAKTVGAAFLYVVTDYIATSETGKYITIAGKYLVFKGNKAQLVDEITYNILGCTDADSKWNITDGVVSLTSASSAVQVSSISVVNGDYTIGLSNTGNVIEKNADQDNVEAKKELYVNNVLVEDADFTSFDLNASTPDITVPATSDIAFVADAPYLLRVAGANNYVKREANKPATIEAITNSANAGKENYWTASLVSGKTDVYTFKNAEGLTLDVTGQSQFKIVKVGSTNQFMLQSVNDATLYVKVGNADAPFTLEVTGNDPTYFTFNKIASTDYQAGELIKKLGDGFNLSIKSKKGDDGVSNFKFNPFQGKLTPVQIETAGGKVTGFKAYDATSTSETFLLQCANGIIVLDKSDSYPIEGLSEFANNGGGYKFKVYSKDDMKDLLNATTGKAYDLLQETAYTFSISHPNSNDLSEIELITVADVNGSNPYRVISYGNDSEYYLSAGRNSGTLVGTPVYATFDGDAMVKSTDEENNPLLLGYVNLILSSHNVKVDGNALAMDNDKTTDAVFASPVEISNVVLSKPEALWAVTADKDVPNYFKFTNRESGKSFEVDNMYYMGSNKYAVAYKDGDNGNGDQTFAYGSDTNIKRDTLIIAGAEVEHGLQMDGYANFTALDVQDNQYRLAVASTSNTDFYVTENHVSKHLLGLDKDVEEAATWRLVPLTNAKEYNTFGDISTASDSIYRVNYVGYYNANGQYKEYKDTLAIISYALQNTANGEYLTYQNPQTLKNLSMVCDENSTNKTTSKDLNEAYRFILKEKQNGLYNLIGVTKKVSATAADPFLMNTSRKLFGATTAASGAVEVKAMYKDINSNDLFDLQLVAAPEYRLKNMGDTIRIFRQENEYDQMFEKGEFLNIGNKAQLTTMAPALYVDTAYVNRGHNNRYQYLLVVDPKYVPAEPCTIEGHPAVHPDTTYGRFLVNLIDTAYVAYTKGAIHTNKYINEGEAGENFAKLGFVYGFRTADKLYITDKNYKKSAKASDVIDLSTSDFNTAKFAFRYISPINHESDGSFKIQTGYYDYNSYVSDRKQPKVSNEGYLKNINGVVVVAKGYDKGDKFDLAAESSNPTANEGVNATSFSVKAIDGAVVIAGAEGKTVTINNVLGQTVASTTITSSEATIAVPAGIVVVAVEGEAAVKAIVK